eukprot:2388559-Rhodomonas_salina.1
MCDVRCCGVWVWSLRVCERRKQLRRKEKKKKKRIRLWLLASKVRRFGADSTVCWVQITGEELSFRIAPPPRFDLAALRSEETDLAAPHNEEPRITPDDDASTRR